MRDLLNRLLACLEADRALAFCRLVETRGSTPQKAGASMLVFEDGSQFGTLGGGFVEAEVKRRALTLVQAGRAEILTFQLDSDYGWDDGLICGGRMQVLVEPLVEAQAVAYFRRLADLLERGQGCTEAIAYDAEKSGLPAPCYFLFDDQGHLAAQCRAPLAGPLPAVLHDNLESLTDRPRARAASGIAFLPNVSRCRLLIVGGGHVGQAVARLAADVDFDICVVDDRAEYVSADRFPQAQQRVAGPVDQVLPTIEVTPDTYCLIVTRGHNHDEEALFHLAERGARYVGMIGSRRKIKLIFDDLLSEGISAEALSRVHAPVGIDIGSQTVAEIAVSIVAELVAHRNLGGQVPGRPDAVAVTSS